MIRSKSDSLPFLSNGRSCLPLLRSPIWVEVGWAADFSPKRSKWAGFHSWRGQLLDPNRRKPEISPKVSYEQEMTETGHEISLPLLYLLTSLCMHDYISGFWPVWPDVEDGSNIYPIHGNAKFVCSAVFINYFSVFTCLHFLPLIHLILCTCLLERLNWFMDAFSSQWWCNQKNQTKQIF